MAWLKHDRLDISFYNTERFGIKKENKHTVLQIWNKR